MKLIAVHTATRTQAEHVLTLDLSASLGGAAERMPYTYDPDDIHGLNWEITAWLMSHPDFPIAPYVEPDPEPDPPYPLYKSIFISRMTSGEAEAMEGVLAAADAKLRMMFNSVEYFISDDPLFATLHGAVAAVLGDARADALLAPTS